jgi:hypothetical protein
MRLLFRVYHVGWSRQTGTVQFYATHAGLSCLVIGMDVFQTRKHQKSAQAMIVLPIFVKRIALMVLNGVKMMFVT